jgi:hypothetical protein
MIGIRKPLVILGTGRSGTTMVSEILFRQMDMGCPLNYNNAIPGFPSISILGKILQSISTKEKSQKSGVGNWSEKIIPYPSEAWEMWDKITGLGNRFSRGFLLNEKPDEIIIRNVASYLNLLLKYQKKKSFFCKFTGPPRIGFLSALLGDPDFVWIKRSIVPTIYSFMNSSFWRKQGAITLWWKGAYDEAEIDLVRENIDDPIWMTAFQLKKVTDTFFLEMDSVRPKIILLNYEELVNRPLFVIEDLFQELQIQLTMKCKHYIKTNICGYTPYPDSYYFTMKDLNTIYNIFNNN